MTSIAIVTYKDFPNLYEDDLLFADELVKSGYTYEAVCWDAPINWARFDHIIIRSTWDYFQHLPQFLEWLDTLDKLEKIVWNPVSLLRWNTDKSYLCDMEKRGIPVIPTIWIEPSPSQQQLNEILATTGWEETILKPSVSCGAHSTVRVNAANTTEHQSTLDRILTSGKAMLQPFLPEIQQEGEYSFMFFGGEYQFTVLKVPKPGDFRVQMYYDSTTVKVTPTENMIAQAQRVMHALNTATLYARVDMVNLNGKLCLMELELIEPTLFLAYDDGSAARLASTFQRIATRAVNLSTIS